MDIRIDAQKCTRCGECVQECPMYFIRMPEEGLPYMPQEMQEQCFACQHCMTVCKFGALSLTGFDPDDAETLDGYEPDPDNVEMLIKSRRSIRRYKQEPVEPETLSRLMEVLSYAPTGKNHQSVLYTLVDDPKVMGAIAERTYEAIRGHRDAETIPEGLEFFSMAVDCWDDGKDIIFREAPHMLIASAPKNAPAGNADTHIGLTTFEVMANALGLGTLWCGFAKWAFLHFAPDVYRSFGIPEDHELGYVLMFGKPAVRYPRLVQRDGAVNVNRVTG